MFVAKKQPTETEHNYVVLTKSKPTSFIFNKFKTSKKYGQQTLEVPEALANVISEYLKFHPLKKNATFKFLVSHDGTPITAVNAITRVLNKVFGKRVGSSMLRHIFLSTKYDIKEMEKDANAMGHSIEEQKKYMKGSGETTQEAIVPTMENSTA
jgi:integrase